ncbi:MAG TPA: hypothetical protein VHX63_16990 [Acidobacteriaceae bacterium]|jgi:hypothetical protein|nr:hypothetical protein [Acidobacteriaceae bacterium]
MGLWTSAVTVCLLTGMMRPVVALAAVTPARSNASAANVAPDASGRDAEDGDAALPDAPLPTLEMFQFGSGPGSVGRAKPMPQQAPVIEPCNPNASSTTPSMSCAPRESPFKRFLSSPEVAPLTPRDKFHLAVKDVFDPFNLLTIAADATISVESDSDGVYGPGLRGIAKYSGVSFTENMTGEFFGTFLVCSLARQDPHYHREPNVSVKRRILHSITQVVWTQSDTGQGMFNYANFVGGIATAAISNTFVPGPGRQGWGATSQRLALAFAISPTGNLITEFLPDVASHVNLHVVIFQRILNMVTKEESGVQ